MSERFRVLYRQPWRIEVTQRDGVRKLLSDAKLARAIDRALVAAKAPSPATIGLILSDDREITALNETHMGHEGPTDVLSFPLVEPGDFRSARPTPPVRRVHLGEIVVSVERAMDQAEAGRGGQTGDVHWAATAELRLLVTHGVLHICGWDHATPEDEGRMRALEQRLLAEPSATTGAGRRPPARGGTAQGPPVRRSRG